MKFCRKCHTIQDNDAIFCPDCGTKLVDAMRRGEKEEQHEQVVTIRGAVKKEKFKYSPQAKMPQINIPKIDFSKIKSKLNQNDVKRIKIGAGLAVAVFVAYFLYSVYGGSLGASFSALSSAIKLPSFQLSGGAVSDNTTNTTQTAPEKQCFNVLESEEVQVPYIYKYKYSVKNAGYITDTSTAQINVENLESIGGTFTVSAEFKAKVGGGLTNVSKSDVIFGSSSNVFEIAYTGSDEVVLNKHYVTPATETRYNTTVQNKTVEKCV